MENDFGDSSKDSLLAVILSCILDAGGGEILVLWPHQAGEVEVQVQFADKFHGVSFVEPGWRVESELREVWQIDARAGFRPVERKEGVSAGRVPERGWWGLYGPENGLSVDFGGGGAPSVLAEG